MDERVGFKDNKPFDRHSWYQHAVDDHDNNWVTQWWEIVPTLHKQREKQAVIETSFSTLVPRQQCLFGEPPITEVSNSMHTAKELAVRAKNLHFSEMIKRITGNMGEWRYHGVSWFVLLC